MRIGARKYPAPEPNPETKPYWLAAQRGVLLVRRCRGCGEAHHYPRTICPFCMSDDTEWQTASGRGVIYSFSVMRQASEPYVIAYVTLAEGPTMLSNIVDADLGEIAIGRAVMVVFRPSEGGPPIPVFTPAVS